MSDLDRDVAALDDWLDIFINKSDQLDLCYVCPFLNQNVQ